MRNTVPDPPIGQRDTARVIEDLCLALRDVGGDTYRLLDERSVSHIQRVKQIHAELEKRGVDYSLRLARLTEETKWQMETLLQECLAYPEVVPYVRGPDGVRFALKCYVCLEREFPDREGLLLCDTCMDRSAESIQTRVPLKGLLLYHMYNEEYWCQHANAETVMTALDDYETLGYAWCAQCIVEERERREKLDSVNS